MAGTTRIMTSCIAGTLFHLRAPRPGARHAPPDPPDITAQPHSRSGRV
ncbi:hypothetical protein [Paraburkholderia lycopersici]|nr:hypothetical protein [Paraburkholderia lycopersici]